MPSPKYGWEDITRNSVGIIHSLEEDGDMGVAFCFRSKPFSCSVTDVEKVPPFELGQEIHVMSSITQPRLGWSNESAATVGKIVRIDMDGALNVRNLISRIQAISCMSRSLALLFISIVMISDSSHIITYNISD